MIIKNLTITNFKSYYSDNEFSFSEGLNVISGHEGSGKSNLFDAFMWVLFKRISGMKADEELSESNISFFNDRIKNEYFISKSSDPILCEVQLTILLPEQDAREYTITRNKKIFLNQNQDCTSFYENNVWSYRNSELVVKYLDKNYNTQEFTDSQAETELDLIFPEKIRKYIWFQGEQINELLDFENPKTLRKAIDYISYLSVYEHMSEIITHTDNILKYKVKNIISTNNRDKKKFDKVNSDIEFIENEIKLNKERKSEKEVTLEKLSIEENDLNEKLSILAGFPDLKAKEGKLEGEIKDLIKEVSNLNDIEKRQFVNKWMLKETDSLFKEANEEIVKFLKFRQNLVNENKKQLAEGIPGDWLIGEMLEKQHCTICDRPAKKGTPEYSSIESQLDANKKVGVYDVEIEDLNEKILNLKDKPSYILSKLTNINTDITKHKEAIDLALTLRNRKIKELEGIREKIKEIIREKGHEILTINANNINQTLIRIRGDKNTLLRNINKISNDIVNHEIDLKTLYAEISKLKVADGVELIEEKLIKYSEFIKAIILKQTQQERLDLINKIQETANDIQRSVANINNIVVVFIEIDKIDYTLKFLDANGNPNYGHGAQNTLAKMSIINAIVKLSNEKKNENYPFIADAPTSDFAMEFTDRFLESISKTYQQTIIITKDLLSNIDYYKNRGYIKSLCEIKKECNEEIPLSTNSITVKK
jgi:DNA sulfur modification protein DndD